MPDETRKVIAMKQASFPAKVCKVCGDAIAWTRRVEHDWEHIQYCSAACRRIGVGQERSAS